MYIAGFSIRYIQSNEVGGSYHMEKGGLEHVLDFLQQRQKHILVTDRHREINKWLRENHPEITHYYMWYVVRQIMFSHLLELYNRFLQEVGSSVKAKRLCGHCSMAEEHHQPYILLRSFNT